MNNLPDVQWQDILANLAPRGGILFIIDFVLYGAFFFVLIATFLQSDKQLIAQLTLAFTLMLMVIAKIDITPAKSIWTLIMNAGIFVLPLIVGGMTKAKNSAPLAVFGGLLGGVYFFAFWFFIQVPGYQAGPPQPGS